MVLGVLYWILVAIMRYRVCVSVQVSFSLSSLVMVPGETDIVDVILSDSTEDNATFEFVFQEDNRLLPYQLKGIISDLDPIHVVPNQTVYHVSIQSKALGEMNIYLNSTSSELKELESAILEVQILYSLIELKLGELCGWIYLFAWSTKQIPQIYLSWRTKSVEGVSLDFVVFNTVGNTAYMLYNFFLFSVEKIKVIYKASHRLGLFPVELNDVICSIIMTLMSFLQAGQFFIFDTGHQRMSRFYTVVLVAITILFTVILIFPLVNIIYWLTFMTGLSYLKVASAPLKFTPQIKHNWERKSTYGWSVYYSWMGLIGGIFSVLQMVINAHNEGDWGSLWGNFPKLLLGSIHIFFNTVLLLQHYILYRENHPYQTVNTNEKLVKSSNKNPENTKPTLCDSTKTSDEKSPVTGDKK